MHFYLPPVNSSCLWQQGSGVSQPQTMQFLLAVLWQKGGDHCQPVLRKCCVIEICFAMLIAHCTKYNGSDGVSPYNMN